MPNHRHVYISLATSMSKTGKFQLTPLVNDVAEECAPLSVVDKLSFVNLISFALPTNVSVISKKTLGKRNEELSKYMFIELRQKLSKIPIVAATTDLWSKAKR